MESFDGARSIHLASDEIRNQCDPCNYDGNENTAVNFCQECKEYLCKACTDSHRRVSLTRNHTILSAELILGQTSKDSTSCKILCESCNSEEVKDFCEQHHIVICEDCKAVKHRKCSTSTTKRKGQSYSGTKIEEIAKQLYKTKANLEQLLESRNADLQNVKDSKESCITEIRRFREEINCFLDTLEENIIKESENKEIGERLDIELQSSSVSTMLQRLKTDLKLLEDAQKTAINSNMFAADIKVSNNLREYENSLQEISKEIKSPVITFKRNELLNNIKKKINEFGTVDVSYVQNWTFKQKLFSDMLVQSSNKVDVKLSDDQNSPTISGCGIFPDGQVILCDCNNHNAKLLHNSTIKESLKLKSNPWDVSVINNSSALITLPWSKQLQFIELDPLKCGRVIQLDKVCWGVQVVGESLYITLHYDPGQGEIRILGLEGKLKRRLGVNQDGSFMFKMPDYLVVSSTLERIYVTDSGTATVTCIEPDGSVVYQYQGNYLKWPRGLRVDAKENLIVCDQDSDNVHLISASGIKSGELLTFDDGVKMPMSVAYRHTDNTLMVCCRVMDYLLVYYLHDEN